MVWVMEAERLGKEQVKKEKKRLKKMTIFTDLYKFI